MAGASQTFVLPPLATPEGCAALHSFLVSSRGAPVRLDGRGVRRAGAQMAQILLAARAEWQAEGRDFTLTASDALRDGLLRLGLEEGLPLEPAA